MKIYLNEIEPFTVAWLRELIKERVLPDAVVDDRSIWDIHPSDLKDFDQCHFFAGIGGWLEAFRLAGIADARSVWSGSCPCQPFSAAGAGAGFADERHLWPAFFHLIDECRPAKVFGEQVASKAGLGWLDLVHADLEGAGYAVRAADLCAAGVGAPHIRQRLWFVADADQGQRGRFTGGQGCISDGSQAGWQQSDRELERGRSDGRANDRPKFELHHACYHGCELGGCVALGRCKLLSRELAERGSEGRRQVGADAGGRGSGGEAQGLDERLMHGGDVELADADRYRCFEASGREFHHTEHHAEPRSKLGDADSVRQAALGRVSTGTIAIAERGPWAAADWLPCRDGKSRPTQPGLLPLAHGIPNRLGTLRGAGNAIVPQVAAEFIKAGLGT